MEAAKRVVPDAEQPHAETNPEKKPSQSTM
jgi:hypothetical protein